VLGIISAVFRDMPILFVQGNMHVQCYRSRLLWFHNNSSLMQTVLLKTRVSGNCILHIGNYDPWFVFMQFWFSPCFVPVESWCSVNIQRSFSHHTVNFVFSDILQAHTALKYGVTELVQWMLKWSGGRKFVGYVV